jgi:hypothetical protein
MQRTFIKKYFLFTVHNSVEKASKERSNIADDARPGVKVAETTLKRLVCSWFRRTGEEMGKLLVEAMSRNKCSSQVRISHVLRLILVSICDVFTDCLSPSTVSYRPVNVMLAMKLLPAVTPCYRLLA